MSSANLFFDTLLRIPSMPWGRERFPSIGEPVSFSKPLKLINLCGLVLIGACTAINQFRVHYVTLQEQLCTSYCRCLDSELVTTRSCSHKYCSILAVNVGNSFLLTISQTLKLVDDDRVLDLKVRNQALCSFRKVGFFIHCADALLRQLDFVFDIFFLTLLRR